MSRDLRRQEGRLKSKRLKDGASMLSSSWILRSSAEVWV